MSRQTSEGAGKRYGLKRVSRVLEFPRSTLWVVQLLRSKMSLINRGHTSRDGIAGLFELFKCNPWTTLSSCLKSFKVRPSHAGLPS